MPSPLTKAHRREAVKKTRVLIAQTWESQLNLSIFLGVLVLTVFVIPSFDPAYIYSRLAGDVTYSIILICAVAIAWGMPRLFTLSACLGVLALGVRWAAWWFQSGDFELVREITTLLSVGLVCWILIVQVFRPGNVTHVRVQGAIAVYLLLGLGWAQAYKIVSYLRPDSFQSAVANFSSGVNWHYFSFVTLTTLGYGDIVPIRPLARSLAIGEALTGQLYLTVLIARLVALEVMSLQPNADADSSQ